MIARTDNSYLYKYLKYAHASGKRSLDPEINLIRRIYEKISVPEVQPGVDKWHNEEDSAYQLFRKYNFGKVSGVTDSTWCIYSVAYVLKEMGYDIYHITDRQHGLKYTTGNEMVGFLRSLTELNYSEAQDMANKGIPIVAGSLGIGKNHGHVAIVAPSINTITNKTEITVGQAGGIIGFYTLYKAFPYNVVDDPTFHMLPKK